MTGGRASSRTAPDDAGVAAVVGVVLVIALLASFYAHEAREAVPRAGAEAERAWALEATRILTEVAAAAADDESQNLVIPPAPEPRSAMRLFGNVMRPLPPQGIISLGTACGSIRAQHVDVHGATVEDLAEANLTCLQLELDLIHSVPAALTVEAGAVVRTQSNASVLVAGPPLQVDRLNATLVRVRHDWPTFLGAAGSASAGATAVPLRLVPLPSAAMGEGMPVLERPNAREASWTLRTGHAQAWHDAYLARMEEAGLPASWYAVSCVPLDCSNDAATGLGRVDVIILGPATDAQADVAVHFDQRVHRLAFG